MHLSWIPFKYIIPSNSNYSQYIDGILLIHPQELIIKKDLWETKQNRTYHKIHTWTCGRHCVVWLIVCSPTICSFIIGKGKWSTQWGNDGDKKRLKQNSTNQIKFIYQEIHEKKKKETLQIFWYSLLNNTLCAYVYVTNKSVEYSSVYVCTNTDTMEKD